MAEEKKKETTTEWFMKWGKKGFFGGLILLIIAIFGGGVGKKSASVTNGADQVYDTPCNFSDETGEFFMKKVRVPANPGSIKLPMGYDVYKTLSCRVVYDYGHGRIVYDAPGKKVDSKDTPNAFELSAEDAKDAGKIIEIRCYRIKNWTPDQAKPISKEVRKVSSKKKVHIVHKKDLPVSDIPSGPQIM